LQSRPIATIMLGAFFSTLFPAQESSMRVRHTFYGISSRFAFAAVLAVVLAAGGASLMGQAQRQGAPPGAGGGQGGRGGPGGPGGGGRGAAAPSNLPASPTAVALPTLSAEVSGPGAMYDSTPSLPPGKGPATYGYTVKEYMVSGTASGQPYNTRIVVRMPAKAATFSGLVLVESMHASGSAHMFEFTSMYTMTSGHAAVEILTSGQQQIIQGNQARYKDIQLAGGQTNEIIAQVGALVKTGKPLGGQKVRKMVLSGTSMSAGVVINYMPAHMVYRTPEMQRIYDGFMPTSNGGQTPDVDVPVIQLPTMLEVVGNVTNRQDSNEQGKQFRLYEFSGIAHIDTRDSVRMKPNPCTLTLSEFPHQAFMAVGLHHLFQWADRGVPPPHGDRIWTDRDERNDGSPMVLDSNGNPRGGIRNTYVDVPTVKYSLRPPAISPVIPNGSAYIANGGQQAANQMCGLSGAQTAFSKEKLKELYGTKQHYVQLVQNRLTELERLGWSLPAYHELILADAAKVDF
jgi:hypothetical protein